MNNYNNNHVNFNPLTIIFDARSFFREEILFESSKVILDVVNDCFNNFLLRYRKKQMNHRHDDDDNDDDQSRESCHNNKMTKMTTTSQNAKVLILSIYCLIIPRSSCRDGIVTLLKPTPLTNSSPPSTSTITSTSTSASTNRQLEIVKEKIHSAIRDLKALQSNQNYFPSSRVEYFQRLKKEQQEKNTTDVDYNSKNNRSAAENHFFATLSTNQQEQFVEDDPSLLIRSCVEESSRNLSSANVKCSPDSAVNIVITTSILVNNWLFHSSSTSSSTSSSSSLLGHTLCFVISDKVPQGSVKRAVTSKLGNSPNLTTKPKSSSMQMQQQQHRQPFLVHVCAVPPSPSSSITSPSLMDANNLLRQVAIGPLATAFGLTSSISVELKLTKTKKKNNNNDNSSTNINNTLRNNNNFANNSVTGTNGSILCSCSSVNLRVPIEEVLFSHENEEENSVDLESDVNEDEDEEGELLQHSASRSVSSSSFKMNVLSFIPISSVDEVWLCGTPCTLRPSSSSSSASSLALKNLDHFRAVQSKMLTKNFALVVQFGAAKKRQALLLPSETDPNCLLLRFFIPRQCFRHDVIVNDLFGYNIALSNNLHSSDTNKDDEDDEERTSRRRMNQFSFQHQNSSFYAAPADGAFMQLLNEINVATAL